MEPRSYPSEEAALRRVEQLVAAGVWPGVRQQADGRWVLTHDPEPGRLHRSADGSER